VDVIRRVDSEPLLLLGGGRALLMQLAHPGVAAGVAEHSDFARRPWARLQHTIRTSSTLVFGSATEARAAAAAMRSVHARVRGSGYRASDPALLLWVHATLVDTALAVHARFFRPLAPDEAELYYQQSATVAELLGIPRRAQPADLAAFRRYVDAMVGSLQVSDTARQVAHRALHPRLPWPAEPGLVLARRLTAGLLPGALREQYGLGWSAPDQIALALTSVASRTVLPRVPAPVRRVPNVLFA